MFEKLLSLLPYNPSLAHQMAFYSRRMREEAAIRRIGLVFIVLAFLVQFFAVISPPQATVADSTSDLINGGFTHKSEAVATCRANTKKYQVIMSNYGVSCDDIAAAQEDTIRSTGHDKQLYTVGWNPDGSFNHRTNKPTNEVSVDLVGVAKPLYWHLVLNQDVGAFTDYKVLKLTSSVTHRTFFILFHCGNLVSIGVPPSIKPCAFNGSILTGDARCVKPCQFNPAIDSTSPNCHPAPCPASPSIFVTDAKCKTCSFDSTIIKSDARCVQCPNPRDANVTASSPSCKTVCSLNNAVDADDVLCKPCTASSDSADALACINVSKTASDPTQNWADANDKTAQPGDTIVYTLYAKNTGQAVVKAFLMEENLSDVLDYATVVELNGGTLDTTSGEVTWPVADIKAGETLSHQIVVKVKDSIPQTPASTSDGSHFDLVMTNVYGNSINIDVPGSPVTAIAATTLVNTGPGTSLLTAAAVVILAGFFYARSRLLAKESILAIQESAGI